MLRIELLLFGRTAMYILYVLSRNVSLRCTTVLYLPAVVAMYIEIQTTIFTLLNFVIYTHTYILVI